MSCQINQFLRKQVPISTLFDKEDVEKLKQNIDQLVTYDNTIINKQEFIEAHMTTIFTTEKLNETNKVKMTKKSNDNASGNNTKNMLLKIYTNNVNFKTW